MTVAYTLAPARPGTLGELVDELVLSAIGVGRCRPETISVFPLAAAVAKKGSWAKYRQGRNRLASLGAIYLNWLAPPPPWMLAETIEAGPRRGLVWRGRDGESSSTCAVWRSIATRKSAKRSLLHSAWQHGGTGAASSALELSSWGRRVGRHW